jgi:hypothetical protein
VFSISDVRIVKHITRELSENITQILVKNVILRDNLKDMHVKLLLKSILKKQCLKM